MTTLNDLALLLSPAVVYGEVDPRAYELLDGVVWDSGSPDRFFRILDLSIEKLASKYGTLAISYSGGVDSAYCLHRLYQMCGPDRVTAVYCDAPTDDQSNYVDTVRRTAEAVAPGCRLEVVVDSGDEPWSERGPSLHSMPSAVAAIERRASGLGAEVLVTGCGADEIVAPPKYLGCDFVAGLQLDKCVARFTQAASIGLGAIVEEFVAPIFLNVANRSRNRRFHLGAAPLDRRQPL